MVVIPRTVVVPTLLGIAVAVPLLLLSGCSPARRIEAPSPTARTCLPPLEAPTPVGTEVAESMSECFVLRVHDVRDLLDLLPVIQLVGPDAIRTVPPEDALVEALLQELDSSERAITTIHATDSGAVMVKGPPRVQEEIAAALQRMRLELVRREAFAGAGSPPVQSAPGESHPFDVPRPAAAPVPTAAPETTDAVGSLAAEEEAALETVPPVDAPPAEEAPEAPTPDAP